MSITRSLSLNEVQTGSGNSEMSGSERDWKSLPQGPLFLVSEQLQPEIDVVRFRSVCTSWRSAAPRRQSPWVVGDSDEFNGCALFTFSGARIPNIPGIDLSRSYCSSYGWLADLSDEEEPISSSTRCKPTLFNPITGDHIHLPVLGINCRMIKLILSSNPATTSDYKVALLGHGRTLYDGKLAICRSGEEVWSVATFPGSSVSGTYDEYDIAFYRGLIYIVNSTRIFVFDPAAGAEAKLVGAIPLPCMELDDKPSRRCRYPHHYRWCVLCDCLGLASYLVESCGDLLLVRKDTMYLGDKTAEVQKLQFGGTTLQGMVKMESLGDRALFLGQGCSFSLSSTKFPEYKGNHIYDIRSAHHNTNNTIISVFNLADGKEESATFRRSHSIWFRPHLQ